MSKKVYTVSSVKRMLSCAGFENDPRGSIALERGSVLHEILELGVDGYSREGSVYRGEFRPYTHDLDFEELEDIATQFMEEHPEYFTPDWKKEQEIHCTTKNGYTISGIVDLHRISSTSAVLLDWKSGISRANINDELDMLQAIWYSYIVLKTKPSVVDVTFSFVYIEEDDAFITINFNINDLKKMESIIERYIFATHFTGLKVNNKCKWCNKRGTCPVLAKEALGLEALGIKKVKQIKGATEAIIKQYKEKKLEEAKSSNDFNGFTTVNMYYLDTSQLSDAERLELVKDKIKLTKKKALFYQEQGKKLTIKKSYRMKA